MRKRRKVLVILGLIAVAAVCFAMWPRNEPGYQGRRLSDWLKRYRESDQGSPKEAEAKAAILAIGTNAVPYLVGWIRHEPGWREWLYDDLSDGIKNTHVVKEWLVGPRRRAQSAAWAFWILGTNAAGAIPELEAVMRNSTTEQTANNAIDALANIRGPALLALKAALDDTNQTWRGRIVWDFGSMVKEGDTNTYLPLIVEALNHGDEIVREAATNVVLQIAPEILTAGPSTTPQP